MNIKKSNYVIFRPHQKKLNYQPQIYIFDNENNKKVSLERKIFIKYLGLLIDENLSWKTHINSVATKISKTIGLIARLRHIVPTCTLLNIYQSLIVPYITYGLISWGNACKTFLDQILVLQKRALRLIYFAETNDHAIPFFVKAKILPVQFLYYESVCNLMLDINRNTAPRNILNLFSRISSVHSYKTRSSTSDHFYTKESRINATRNAFSRVGVKIWNGIPATLKKSTKKSFKESLKGKLFDILENVDSYIEVEAIIDQMKN